MLSLVGGETESSGSVAWKVDVGFQTWGEQQACDQRQIARHRLETAIPVICRSHGKKHFAQLSVGEADSFPYKLETPKDSTVIHLSACAKQLAYMCGFCAGDIGRAVILAPFAEKLANHFFDRHFLDVDVADVACFKQLPACLGDFCAWNFQLH